MSRGKDLLHAAVEYLADRQVSRARQVLRVAMAYGLLFLLIMGAGQVLNEVAELVRLVYLWHFAAAHGMPNA